MDPPEQSSTASVPCRHCGDLHPPAFSHCPKTGRSLTAGNALAGRVIAGRYRVLALIGEGGMGAVYAAEHLLMGRKVALKRLHPELASDEKAIARFQREARAAASTGHEHIVEILDLGFGEDGAPFLVMEYLRGKSLKQLLDEESRLPPARACRIVGQLLAALGAVHRRGIVHRDLKPDNILLTRRQGDPDFVKVVDFGISKMRQEDTERGMALTRTGVMLGTPFYMSPEQARGMKDLDHRVDLFGAGVILYESLSGQLPFAGDNYHQLLQAILSGKREPILALRPDLSLGLAAVVEKAIALSPGDRYQTAREMLSALLPYGAEDPGHAESERPPPDTKIAYGATLASALGSQPGVSGRREPSPTAAASSEDLDPSSAPTRASDASMSTPAFSSTPGRFAPSVSTSGLAAGRYTPSPRGLAPEPRAVEPPPRHFVAQSADWKASEPSGASGSRARPAAAYREIARIPTPRGRPIPPSEPSPPLSPRVEAPLAPRAVTPSASVASEHTKVKGSLVLSAMEHLRAAGGGAIDRVLAQLDVATASRLRAILLPMAWVDLLDYAELLRAAERELGPGDASVVTLIGQATADRELTTTHRLFMQSATPTMAVERIPQLFRTYHSAGRVRIRKATAGGYRVEVTGVEPDTVVHALVLSGFWQRLLELTGARDARAAVVSSRERGDAETVTVLRWR